MTATPVVSPEQRLRELGLQLPAAAAAHDQPWAVVGHTFMTTGQTPRLEGELKYTGRIGRDLTAEQGYAACRLAALNGIAQMRQALGGFDRLKQIHRLECVLNVAPGFGEQQQVLDGASDLLTAVFGERGRHTRMISTNPVMPFDSACLISIYADVTPPTVPSETVGQTYLDWIDSYD